MYRFCAILSGSQEERIGILQMALTEKGAAMSNHYDPAQPISALVISTEHSANQATGPSATSTHPLVANSEPVEDSEDGVFLVIYIC